MTDALLRLENLSIRYQVRGRQLLPVENISLAFARGQITAIIGESGCGKSTLTAGLLGILASNSQVDPKSRIWFNDQDLLSLTPEARRRFRWQKASMVFQAAQTALSPTLRIGEQLIDTVLDHEKISRAEALARAEVRLRQVRLEPERVMTAYPHQLSGGMRQRVMIALALMLEPELILLDEPTTALDVITQHYIFDILLELWRSQGMTMLLITHDLSAAADLAGQVVVMYGGRIMENAPAKVFFQQPLHPYSEGLLRAQPTLDGDTASRQPIDGHPPDLADKPTGCVFHPRCAYVQPSCRSEVPLLETLPDGRQVACPIRPSQLNPTQFNEVKP